MMIHSLKIESKYFWEVWQGKKTFEIRKNDRNLLRVPQVTNGQIFFGKEGWPGSARKEQFGITGKNYETIVRCQVQTLVVLAQSDVA